MAPATKKRKVAHDDVGDSARTESSFANSILFERGSSFMASDEDESDSGNHISIPFEDDEDQNEHNIGIRRPDSEAVTTNGREEGKKASTTQGNQVRPNKGNTASQDGIYTAEVYKSNMFKLQVDDLLHEVKLKYGKKEAPAENAMRTLKVLIEQLPSRTPLAVSDAQKALKSEGIAIPFPDPPPPQDAKYKLQYDRPSSINVTGSYSLKTTTRTGEGFAIDLVVTMASNCLQEKDYLNYRYFYKRAYYLACITSGIKSSKEHNFNLSFDLLNGNHLQPILVIHPHPRGADDNFAASKCRINILIALPEKTFPESKLSPASNCIRSKGVEDDSENKKVSPTPFYNSSIQSDASVTAYLKLLHSASGRCDAYSDACILGRIWLRQRGFGGSIREGGFGSFEWATIMAILLSPDQRVGMPSLSPGYSSYQLFKATLQFLAGRDLSNSPYKFKAEELILPKDDTTPIFFDGPRNLNILFKMTPWSYPRLRYEAKKTIEMLSDPRFDQFESTFISKVNAIKYQYDATILIPISALKVNTTGEGYQQRLFKNLSKLHSNLIRALTDRVVSLNFVLPSGANWPVDSSSSIGDQNQCLLINVATNPATANRTMDYGPAADEKKDAASFRHFWGEKAELRRFKDGSILESVVWKVDKTSKPILEQIIFFTLQRHHGAELASVSEVSMDTFANMISFGSILGQSGVTPFISRMNTFATLEQDMRNLEGLPLSIRHISAADSLLRYAAIETASSYPASLTVQFEGSARWPDDLCAIQRTKIAFLLKLSELLSSAKPEYICRIGLENPSQPSQNQAYLDISLPSSFSFRLRVHHEREAPLLERQLKDRTLDGQSRESAASALAAYKRNYIHSPAHTRALQSLCTQYPALSPSIRLTKHWFASHLLTTHFTPEFIELLVARTFLQPHPWSVPSCATTGFLRTLSWLARWDWRHSPLIVDFSSPDASNSYAETEGNVSRALKLEDIDKIYTRFQAWRRIDPAMNRVVLFAATNLDTEGTTWTDTAQPERVVAARMTALAKAATQLVRAEEDRLLFLASGKSGEASTVPLSPQTFFVPTLQDYDVIIHISSKYSEAGKKKSEPRFKNLQLQQKPEEVASVDYKPVQSFVDELLAVYEDSILWFLNPETLDTICGLWNPNTTAQRAWKVKPGWNSVPISIPKSKTNADGEGHSMKSVDIEVNKHVIYHEIKRLGGELVDKIQVK